MKRKLSLLLAAVAFVVVPLWAYFQGEAEASAQRATHGWVCGMPILGLYLLALFVSGILSATSLTFGTLAYRSLSIPRPKIRQFELLVIALPLLGAIAVVLALLATGA